MEQPTKKILLDCDPGHDDALAILLALASPELELLGISVVAGNSILDNNVRNACRVLELIGRTDIPVSVGHAGPLARPLVLGTADGPSGLEGSPYLPEPTMETVKTHAVDFLANKLSAQDEPITFVATGPLTNVAALLLKYPHVKEKIKEIIFMGGSFLRPNPYHTITEFNIFCDPEAANVVMRSGIPLIAIGLDVTMKVLVEEPQLRQIRAIDTPLARVLEDWLLYYEKLHRGTMGVGGAMHDPLCIAVAVDPSIVTTRSAYVETEIVGRRTFGYTVADFWNELGEPNCEVAVAVDADRFWDMFIDRLAKLEWVNPLPDIVNAPR